MLCDGLPLIPRINLVIVVSVVVTVADIKQLLIVLEYICSFYFYCSLVIKLLALYTYNCISLDSLLSQLQFPPWWAVVE